MGVRETSKKAYKEVLPDLSDRQEQILNLLHDAKNSLTDKEMSKILGRPINTITPRRNELCKKGLVIEDERRECDVTGREAWAWTTREAVDKNIDDNKRS